MEKTKKFKIYNSIMLKLEKINLNFLKFKRKNLFLTKLKKTINIIRIENK